MLSWGRFDRNNRYNKDEVPLPFVVSLSDTCEEKGTKEVCIKPMKPGIVFRGKGMRISPVEKAAWDDRVHVMFQENAWVDRATNDKFTKEVLFPYLAANHASEDEKNVF